MFSDSKKEVFHEICLKILALILLIILVLCYFSVSRCKYLVTVDVYWLNISNKRKKFKFDSSAKFFCSMFYCFPVVQTNTEIFGQLIAIICIVCMAWLDKKHGNLRLFLINLHINQIQANFHLL